MKHTRALFSGGWIFSVLFAVAAFAQESVEVQPQAEQQFQRGVELYSAGNYRAAVAAFDDLMITFASSSRMTGAMVMKGKALYHLHEYLESAKTLKTFLIRYPGSSYVADAHLGLGQVYQRIGRASDAMDELVLAWRNIPSTLPEASYTRLTTIIIASLDSVVDASADLLTLQSRAATGGTADERAYFWTKIAEKEAQRGNVDSAGAALDTVLTRYATTAMRARAATLKDRISGTGEMRVGLLLPLMQQAPPSALREPGNEVYEGILIAYERFLKESSSRLHVTLEVKDTEREPAVALRRARELAQDPGMLCIIGPVFSPSTSAAVSAAAERGIPLVSPTANANGIAAAGATIFQANPDYDMRGRAMARYAMADRGWSTFAVMAPSDTYAKFLANGFIDEVRRRGGEIVATEWYQKGTTDLKGQLANIRRAAFQSGNEPLISFAGKMPQKELMKFVDAGVPLARLDSLMAQGSTIPASMLLGSHPRARADSLGIKLVFDDTRADSIEIPVGGIDACYAPISGPEDIGVVAAQYVYFNLKAQLLGSGEWANMSALSENKEYARGVLFESDSHIDSANIDRISFVRAYTARFGKPPARNAMYGYDTARLIFTLIGQGATTRGRLTEALASVRDYRGIHSRVGFSAGRVNSWLHILEFNGEGVVKVGEVHVE